MKRKNSREKGAGGERERRYLAADAKFAKAAVFGADVGDGR